MHIHRHFIVFHVLQDLLSLFMETSFYLLRFLFSFPSVHFVLSKLPTFLGNLFVEMFYGLG